MSAVDRRSSINFSSSTAGDGLCVVARETEIATSVLENVRWLAIDCTGSRVRIALQCEGRATNQSISLSQADALLAARRLIAEAERCGPAAEQSAEDERGVRRCPVRNGENGSQNPSSAADPDQSSGERRPEAPTPPSRSPWLA